MVDKKDINFYGKALEAILNHAKNGCNECEDLILGIIAESHEEAYKK